MFWQRQILLMKKSSCVGRLLSAQDCDDAIQDRHGEEDEPDKWFVCVFHVYSDSIGFYNWLTHA